MDDNQTFPLSWEGAVRWLLEHPDKDMRWLARACYFDETPVEAATRFADSPEWQAVRELLPLPEGGRALDLGAGRGVASFALARDGWTVDAVEPYDSDLVGIGAISEIARIADLPIDVHQVSAEGLPFEDSSFDIVHCRQALHHAADIKQMCREAHRVLKPGGVFICTREHVLSRRSDLQAFLDSHPLHRLYGGENAYTLEEYKAAFFDADLKNLEIYSPYQSIINIFPSTFEEERIRMARIAKVKPEDIKDFIFLIRDHYDQTPGRLYTFRMNK